jgi:Fe-S cluster biogenesis protein NfuA
VVKKEAFQEKIRQLGTLVGELDAMPGDGSNTAARELVQLLMEVHGTGLNRLLEIVYESGESGEAIIAKAGEDPIVRHLLVLYSLHPEPMESRVLKALDAAAPRLRKMDSEVELIGISDGAVQVRVTTAGHGCGSTARSAQSIVEEMTYDMAPDLTSLEILGPVDEVSSGFVSLDSLLKHPVSTHAIVEPAAEVCSGD